MGLSVGGAGDGLVSSADEMGNNCSLCAFWGCLCDMISSSS